MPTAARTARRDAGRAGELDPHHRFGPGRQAVLDVLTGIQALDELAIRLLAVAWGTTPLHSWSAGIGAVGEAGRSSPERRHQQQACRAALADVADLAAESPAALAAGPGTWRIAAATFDIVDALAVADLADDLGTVAGLTGSHVDVIAAPWRSAHAARTRLAALESVHRGAADLASCLLVEGWTGPLCDLPGIVAGLLTGRP